MMVLPIALPTFYMYISSTRAIAPKRDAAERPRTLVTLNP
jgi:hypothetical protein